MEDQQIRMFDPKNYASGPFLEFSVFSEACFAQIHPDTSNPTFNLHKFAITKLEFTPNGEELIAMSNSGMCLLYNAMDGSFVRAFQYHQQVQEHQVPLGTSISADGQYLATGSEDGKIFISNLQSGELVKELAEGHVGPVTNLQWSPSRHVLVSAHLNTIAWIAGPALD